MPGGVLRFKSVLSFFDTRMRQIKVFRRRLVEAPWGLDRPHWVDDNDVDIEYHVRHIALPQPGDWRQLMIQVARLHSRSMDKSKPLWEAYIIEGLDNIQGIAPGSFALYIKFHHAAVDGEAGVEILRAIHSLSPLPDHGDGQRPAAIIADRDPTSVELLASTVSHRTRQVLGGAWLMAGLGKRAVVGGVNLVTSGKALNLGRQVLGGRLGIAELAAEIAGPYGRNLHVAPRTRFSGKISAHRVVDVVGYSLAECKNIREHVEGVTINDIFMAAAGGALRKYLDLKGELPTESLNALMPLSTRGEQTGHDESNQVGMAAVPLGTDIADPLERLLAVHRASNRGKSLSAAVGNDLPAKLVEHHAGGGGRTDCAQRIDAAGECHGVQRARTGPPAVHGGRQTADVHAAVHHCRRHRPEPDRFELQRDLVGLLRFLPQDAARSGRVRGLSDRKFYGIAERCGQQGNTGKNPVRRAASAENSDAGSEENAR